MPDYFRNRLHRDLKRFSTPAGFVNIANMLAVWAADSDWTRVAIKMPPTERRNMLAELGGETFDRDGGRYATSLRNNTSGLGFICSGVLWNPC